MYIYTHFACSEEEGRHVQSIYCDITWHGSSCQLSYCGEQVNGSCQLNGQRNNTSQLVTVKLVDHYAHAQTLDIHHNLCCLSWFDSIRPPGNGRCSHATFPCGGLSTTKQPRIATSPLVIQSWAERKRV